MAAQKYSDFIRNSNTLESEIIKLISTSTQHNVAKELGVSQATVSRILKRLGYKRKYAKEVGEVIKV